ncbi:hypothetical protein C8P70_1352 [Myroides indicus]|uniref:Uncharacterized protein n=1 Tax=Myroides indicus TaxID=1323422 RepID=A0A4R7ESV7_9FLAO|nr:hypothetical protein C8P70_1352 [Myroides indicus]
MYYNIYILIKFSLMTELYIIKLFVIIYIYKVITVIIGLIYEFKIEKKIKTLSKSS